MAAGRPFEDHTASEIFERADENEMRKDKDQQEALKYLTELPNWMGILTSSASRLLVRLLPIFSTLGLSTRESRVQRYDPRWEMYVFDPFLRLYGCYKKGLIGCKLLRIR